MATRAETSAYARLRRAGATCIQRPSDMFARIGGEEFAAILGDTELAGGITVAESIWRVVGALQYEHRGSTLGRVSVCIGDRSDGTGRRRRHGGVAADCRRGALSREI